MFLSVGSKGDLVEKLQENLLKMKFDPGAIDGYFGKKTRAAVLMLQKAKGLVIDGIVGPVTFKELGIKVKLEKLDEARESFKLLTLANPNYFGNLELSPYKPVLSKCCDTYYEEMICLGYQPQQKQLGAVVYVYQPSGYGTGLCGAGTPEFVRFYLSYDNGATWQDQGMSSFQAKNIPQGTWGEKHLEYAVSLSVEPNARLCWLDPLVKVRAVLSWNDPPPPNQPNWKPVWGNVRENSILIEPWRLIPLGEIIKGLKPAVTFPFEEVFDMDQIVPQKAGKLDVSALTKLYKSKGVPVHRFAFKELMAISAGKMAPEAISSDVLTAELAQASDIIGQLTLITDGDTSYEELTCIGLDPNTPDTLVGVVKVKKACGYLGNPCSDGSKEYVTFWADFDDNGSFETCLGTAEVNVYDVNSAPADGVHYAVRLPVDLDEYRQPCADGPVLVPIRAILSWNVPVPGDEPNKVPRWGNREETVINIAPSASKPAGQIAVLGGIPVGHIDDITGLTDADAVFAVNNLAADSAGRPCPFGGRVTVQGLSIPGWSYKVEVSEDNNVWSPVLTKLIVTDKYGNTSPHTADPTTKRFTYLPFNQNVTSLLAQWDTAGNALWYVRLTVYDGSGVEQGIDSHVIQLDNTQPEGSIDITTGMGNCGKFYIGDLIGGRFVARDDYLRDYLIYVAPSVNTAPIGVPSPDSGTTNTAVAPGDVWELDTAGMKVCGYTMHVRVRDRVIINSQKNGHYRYDSAGFCLEALPAGEEKE